LTGAGVVWETRPEAGTQTDPEKGVGLWGDREFPVRIQDIERGVAQDDLPGRHL